MKAYPRGLPAIITTNKGQVLVEQASGHKQQLRLQFRVGCLNFKLTCCILHQPYPLDRTILFELSLELLLSRLKTDAGDKEGLECITLSSISPQLWDLWSRKN